MIKKFKQNYKYWILVFYDLMCIPIAWFGAFLIQFDLNLPPAAINTLALSSLPGLLICQTLSFWVVGLYREIWRVATLIDLLRIMAATLLGAFFILEMESILGHLELMPKVILPLYSMLLILLIGGGHFFYRVFRERNYFTPVNKRILIIGAGFAGESLARELLRDLKNQHVPIGFVDNDKKIGTLIHGIKILGKIEEIPSLVKQYAIEQLYIAIPEADALEMRKIYAICEATKKRVRTLPGMNNLAAGFASLKNLRDISIEDLLGRTPIDLDWSSITHEVADQVILVCGGAGSIGSELCRQILQLAPHKLIIIDNSEYNLFNIQQELNTKWMHQKHHITYHLLDICDKVALEQLIELYQPSVVFHAAAYKHVPLLEQQIWVGARNNILGTYLLAKACVEHQVKKFIFISTDKTAHPTNVMASTKRIAELICHYFAGSYLTIFILIRFGNVLNSKGSVVEIFEKQLAKGGPLTVTHPEIKRFFMTITQASQLILQTLSLIEKPYELFTLDMGEPVRITYLAEQMIRLEGKDLNDIGIDYIGLRPGEKLFEELTYNLSDFSKTKHPKILRSHLVEVPLQKIDLEQLLKAIQSVNVIEICQLIRKIVPQFRTQLLKEISSKKESLESENEYY